MGTLKAMIETDVTDVFLNTDDFAETIAIYQDNGLQNPCTSVTALVVFDESHRERSGGSRQRIAETVHLVSDEWSDSTLRERDLYMVIDGRKYTVSDVGPDEAGLRPVAVVHSTEGHVNAEYLDPN